MTQERKIEFQRRLTQSNRSGVILIMYEIIFESLDAALTENRDRETYKNSLRKAQEMIRELMYALDFQYPLSKSLASLYQYSNTRLSMSMYEHKPDKIIEVKKILTALYDSFAKAAKEDHSGPMMRNTQQVYTGMTYGKDNLAQNYVDGNIHRGFLA